MTIDGKKIVKFEGSSHPNRTGKQAAVKWFKSCKKLEGKNNWLIKDINNMRAVINTSTSSLGEEGSKTI